MDCIENIKGQNGVSELLTPECWCLAVTLKYSRKETSQCLKHQPWLNSCTLMLYSKISFNLNEDEIFLSKN